ncbi:MAG: hypothetical protein ACOC04_04420 [Halothece sp.]
MTSDSLCQFTLSITMVISINPKTQFKSSLNKGNVSVNLQPVTEPGIAPTDFYATTIHPTDICIGGQWMRVKNPRESGAIVIRFSPTPQAECHPLRDLQVGDLVVVGKEGVRVKTTSFQQEEEFGFMSATVSSERPIEALILQITKYLLAYREAGFKVAVCAGKDVAERGGLEALVSLIRNGYVQALVTENAIASYDLSLSLYNTERRQAHAINEIRRYGNIAKAVEQGILNAGLFYECNRLGVPFAIAGSLEDEPLPDTLTDTVIAQQTYARLLYGADMILMLSAGMSAMAVRRMTPAGVKVIAVDINPAVVQALCDYDTAESIGIVTDVGLFLTQLVQQLNLALLAQV